MRSYHGQQRNQCRDFSFKDGINLSKFPIVEEVKEVFLLYRMKRITMTMAHTPVSTNRDNMSFGDNEKG